MTIKSQSQPNFVSERERIPADFIVYVTVIKEIEEEEVNKKDGRSKVL